MPGVQNDPTLSRLESVAEQVAHDGPEHISSHSAIEEMTTGHSFRLVLYIRALFRVTCTCAFLTTLLALMFNSQSSGMAFGQVAHGGTSKASYRGARHSGAGTCRREDIGTTCC